MSIIDEFTRAEWAEMFAYLDRLREMGVTNMLAAGPYLEGHFDLDAAIARKVLSTWMQTFDTAPALDRVDRLMEAE